MRRQVEEWTDARLDDMAAAMTPVPAQVAVLGAAVEDLERAVDRLSSENAALRDELAALQRQLLQIAWAMVAALVSATMAVLTALV
jgi:hypothetical protein